MATYLIGREIVVLEETTSTNDCVLQMATADRRKAWSFSPNIKRPAAASAATAGNLRRTKAFGFRSCSAQDRHERFRATHELGREDRRDDQSDRERTIKPPNDVYVDGRKVAGVLVEMRAQEKAPHLAILGIGVNVNQMPEDFSADLRDRAASLAMLRPGPQDRHLLAVALLRNLDRTYAETFG